MTLDRLCAQNIDTYLGAQGNMSIGRAYVIIERERISSLGSPITLKSQLRF